MWKQWSNALVEFFSTDDLEAKWTRGVRKHKINSDRAFSCLQNCDLLAVETFTVLCPSAGYWLLLPSSQTWGINFLAVMVLTVALVVSANGKREQKRGTGSGRTFSLASEGGPQLCSQQSLLSVTCSATNCVLSSKSGLAVAGTS